MSAPCSTEHSATAAPGIVGASSATTPSPTPAQTDKDERLLVRSLDIEAQGIAHRANGKVVFIEGALPSEWVSVNIHRKKNQWEAGTVQTIYRPSAQRVLAGCAHFGLHTGACGGCKMQHLHPSAQVAVKQRSLEDSLWHLGKVKAQTLLPPIEGPSWGYRYRARLSVRYVRKKNDVLIGFHERKSSYVADIKSCPVLAPHVSALLMPLRALIVGMDARQTCPQIELACTDEVTVLVLRHLDPLSEPDLARLRTFASQHSVQWWLQAHGPASAQPLAPRAPGLSYRLPEFDISIAFKPTDFTQVNPHVNQVLVRRALRLLNAQPHERVIDWFCGLGNFTLPIATQAAQVLGVEGSAGLVERACANFQANQTRRTAPLAHTTFAARNLFEMTPALLVDDGTADKWLIDPPREGAFALVKALAELHQQPALRGPWTAPQRIVYVSCNPATLARDAALLVHQAGYVCTQAGIVNMFAHTAHVESLAVFDRLPTRTA